MTGFNRQTADMTTTSTPALSADPRPSFAECASVARSVVAEVWPDDGDRPTPSGMAVGDLVPHLVMAMQRTACMGRGLPVSEWPVVAPPVSLPDAAAVLDATLSDAESAWADDAVLGEPRPLPWDPSPLGAESLAVYVAELLLHTWDLAHGIGAEASWSDDTVAVALAVMHKQLPMADRTPIWTALAAAMGESPESFDAPYANAVPVADDATPLAQLLAWCGRRPLG